jgi:glucose/arabinose dehydrogenase
VGSLVAVLALVGVLLTPSAAQAATLPSGFAETTITGLTQPTSMVFAPDGRLFVAQKTGAIRVIQGGKLLPTPFLTLTVDTAGERGVIGITLHPNFPTTNRVYVQYTVPGSPSHNRVSWWAANGNVATGPEHIVTEMPGLGAVAHNGGAIHFGKDGQLYVAVGENTVKTNSQDLTTPKGKLLRVTEDGAPSPGNPFADGAGPNDDRIYAMGLRNPFTFAVQPVSGTIFVNDVGSTGTGACGTGTWEEINKVSAGANFGWPIVEGPPGPNCDETGFTPPLYTYSHSDPDAPCALVGGDFYNPSATPLLGSSYVGDYFFTDLCTGKMRYRMPYGQVHDFASGINRPVDIATGPDGALWYLSIGDGLVGRITATPNPNTIVLRNNAASGPAQLSVKFGEHGDTVLFCDWDGNGTDTPGVFRNGTWFLRNSNSSGLADVIVKYGAPGDIPVCGKWKSGATADTIGVYRNNTFYLRTANSPGYASMTVPYGQSGDVPVVGDWDGDGVDTIGVFRSGQFLLRNSNTAGAADITVAYGMSTDTPIVGDWDGDGTDTIGVHHGAQFLLRNSNTAGSPDITTTYGLASDTPLKGDFDRMGSTNRGDGIAIAR